MAKFNHQSGQTVAIDGAEIYYETIGNSNNYPVVLLHGGMCNLTSFNPLAEYLDDYYLVAIDSRGHGKSTLGDVPLSYERLQSDVKAIIRGLDIKHCAIIGHSDGGIVALRLAAEQFAPLDKVVVIGASWILKDKDPVREVYQGITAEYWKQKFHHDYVYYQQNNPVPNFDHLINTIKTMWLDDSSSSYPAETIRHIEQPVLVCRGDNDFLVSLSHSREIVDRVKQSALFNVPYTSHVVHEERPEWIANTICYFLNEINSN
ncbi:alpha/beta fold hydrolase [Xenorhabdus sp. PB30.3]|uniref:alpha/beta fold hydrolase n=1 Tax=Xenorhabdus sp. PB30.3 TaxID=2788941 RepID=UPI001E506702|nr:alpha/beta hydrolase [Xenorhabdus sp. PB30.3]MCC8379181.1 alpha/beta hydrolase [Xenorhabdus sp. PB30.3]